MPPSVLFGSAILPSILLVSYFHKRDLYPEPPRLLWWTFFLGILTPIPVLILDQFLEPFAEAMKVIGPAAGAFGSAFFTAGIPEELCKLAVLLWYSMRQKEFDEPMDGIVYGAIASLGFATLENILYVGSGDLSTAIMRAITAVPMHAAFGAIMGGYLGYSVTHPQSRWMCIIKGYAAAVFLHTLYDWGLMAAGPADNAAWLLLTLGTMIASFIWTRRLQNIALQEQQTRGGVFNSFARKNIPVPQQASAGDKIIGGIQLLVGFIFAGLGSTAILGLGLAVVFGELDAEAATAGIVFAGISILPTLLGFWLFKRGLRNINGHA